MIVVVITEPLIERRRGEVVVAVGNGRLPQRLKCLMAHLLEPLALGLDLDLRDQVIGLKEVVVNERMDGPDAGVFAGIKLEAVRSVAIVLPVDLRALTRLALLVAFVALE